MSVFDTIIRNGSVLVEEGDDAQRVDIGIRDGRITRLEERIDAPAAEEIDAQGCLVVPGAIDSHFHLGIYRDLGDDAWSETRAAAAGGVTSIISYYRTGNHYLNRSGSYREILPEVLDRVEGRAHVDYGFHIAPMTREHLKEIAWLAEEMGVTSFKFFWSYVGAVMDPASDGYDGAFALELMERVAALNAGAAGTARISLSVHCEDADILTAYAARAEALSGTPLDRYSQARPSVAEAISIHKTVQMAAHTGAPVNLLHLSSADAVQALREARLRHPAHDVRAETGPHYMALPGHLGEDQYAKVNPPIRGRESADALWEALRTGGIDWLGSDHCCSLAEHKQGDLWDAVPGFGGTAYLYPFLLGEGHLAGRLTLGRAVALASAGPARAYGLYGPKGRIGIGADADIAIFDAAPGRIEAAHSAQDFAPYGSEYPTRVRSRRTLLRGTTVAVDGAPVGEPTGRYLRRPLTSAGGEP